MTKKHKKKTKHKQTNKSINGECLTFTETRTPWSVRGQASGLGYLRLPKRRYEIPMVTPCPRVTEKGPGHVTGRKYQNQRSLDRVYGDGILNRNVYWTKCGVVYCLGDTDR